MIGTGVESAAGSELVRMSSGCIRAIWMLSVMLKYIVHRRNLDGDKLQRRGRALMEAGGAEPHVSSKDETKCVFRTRCSVLL